MQCSYWCLFWFQCVPWFEAAKRFQKCYCTQNMQQNPANCIPLDDPQYCTTSKSLAFYGSPASVRDCGFWSKLTSNQGPVAIRSRKSVIFTSSERWHNWKVDSGSKEGLRYLDAPILSVWESSETLEKYVKYIINIWGKIMQNLMNSKEWGRKMVSRASWSHQADESWDAGPRNLFLLFG